MLTVWGRAVCWSDMSCIQRFWNNLIVSVRNRCLACTLIKRYSGFIDEPQKNLYLSMSVVRMSKLLVIFCRDCVAAMNPYCAWYNGNCVQLKKTGNK